MILWRASSLRRIAYCGRFAKSTTSGITVRARDGIAGFAGLQSCGSVWACPICSSKILTHRALEIGAVLGQAMAEGYSLGFGTLTMRHRRGQPLEFLWDAANRGWRRAISGKGWTTVRDRTGLLGFVRVWEVTDGANGWHVHVHFVVVLRAGATQADLDQVASGMFRRWSSGLEAAGLSAPLLRGQEWHLVGGDQAAEEVAAYLTKITDQGDGDAALGLGLELTHTAPGRSRSGFGTRPVWSLLDDLERDGESATLARWHEWEKVSKGRRQVGWSQGIRARFAPALPERSDEDVAAEELGTKADDLVMITPDGWVTLLQTPSVFPTLLEAAEAGGLGALAPLLDGLGADYLVVAR